MAWPVQIMREHVGNDTWQAHRGQRWRGASLYARSSAGRAARTLINPGTCIHCRVPLDCRAQFETLAKPCMHVRSCRYADIYTPGRGPPPTGCRQSARRRQAACAPHLSHPPSDHPGTACTHGLHFRASTISFSFLGGRACMILFVVVVDHSFASSSASAFPSATTLATTAGAAGLFLVLIVVASACGPRQPGWQASIQGIEGAGRILATLQVREEVLAATQGRRTGQRIQTER
mmetsp:Transcript_21784/g.70441  ORF Transcript_21784/g.70441 Transcript_21784/m.70441 type:complete len:234 (+) Transcript_21784:202-903(+)